MRVCRSKTFTALLAVVAVFGGSAALAQQTGPVRLTPPTRLQPTAPNPATSVAPTANAPAAATGQPDYKAGPGGQSVTTLSSIGASGIQVDRLQVVTPDSAGILSTENGGFGVDMWRGTSMARAMEMLARVPARLASPTLAGLVRRLVLTTAAPPEGPSDGEKFAVRRLAVLIAMADYPAALDLLSVMPRQGRGPGLLRAEAELHFLSGDNIAGCALVGNEVRRSQADFWQKALVYCQLLSDQPEKAELGISLLREIGADDDLFYRLTEAMIRGGTADLTDMTTPLPLAVAMVGQVAAEAGSAMIAGMRTGMLRALALNARLAPPLRLAVTERAAELGIFSDSALRKLVLQIAEQLSPTAGEPATGADSVPQAVSGAVMRARLFMAAARAGVPAAKAEAASRALRSAVDDGVFAATARLFGNELAVVPASTENIWFAADAIRAAALNGAIEQARNWLLLLRRTALLSPESAKALDGLKALLHVMGEAEPNAKTATVNAGDGRRTVLAHAILAGLGDEIDAAQWVALADAQGDGVAAPPMPAPALWFALRAINDDNRAAATVAETTQQTAQAGTQLADGGVLVSQLGAPTPGTRADLDNKAARVLLMVRVVGERHPAELNPILLSEVIRGLTTLGFDAEARAFGLEAALGGGL